MILINVQSLVHTAFVLQFENVGSLHQSQRKGRCTKFVFSRDNKILVVCLYLSLIMITTMNLQVLLAHVLLLNFRIQMYSLDLFINGSAVSPLCVSRVPAVHIFINGSVNLSEFV